jgi:polysaccharide deacetylase
MAKRLYPLSCRRVVMAPRAATAAALPPVPAEASPTSQGIPGPAADTSKALVAITFDLEMSMRYPTCDQMEWNYEKGLLDDASKSYTLEAVRHVKAIGGRMHNFVVGRVCEQENVEWLEELHREGPRFGNHTYDHVYIRATRVEDIQPRFQRAPWLIEGKGPQEVIRENILMCERAMQARLGFRPQGFRAPGGFSDGISTRPDVRLMLLSLGYDCACTRYTAHPVTKPGDAPTARNLRGIVSAQKAAQPFIYPSGLIEVPASPITGVVAFRTCRWRLSTFQQAIRGCLQWAIENRAVFDFTCHPSVSGVVDPGFETLGMVLEIIQKAGERVAIVDPETLALHARLRKTQEGKV